jgi:putative oxidoreductase
MLMLSAPQRDLVRDKGTKLGRILIGLLFFASGLSMLLMTGPAGTAEYFASLGIPLAGIVVWLVIAVKIVAGLAIILGYRVGLAASSLILFTIGATIAAHRDFADPNLLKNLAIVGGLMYLMAYGPGGSNTSELSTK